MKLLNFFSFLLLFVCCQSDKKHLKSELAHSHIQKQEILYNIIIDSLTVKKETIRKGESVGKILNNYASVKF